MRGDMVSELRLAALYANQVARAIVRMDDRLSKKKFNAMRSTYNTFAIDVLGTADLWISPFPRVKGFRVFPVTMCTC